MSRVVILLSTYNGEKYLKEQLDSLFAQSYQNFEIVARDDGSSDRTLEILREYGVEIVESSENIGVKESFGLLLEWALEHSGGEYFMFCDQDDVWSRDKIKNSMVKMEELENSGENSALLVHSDLVVVDEELKVVSGSFYEHQRLDYKASSFKKLLIQNIVVGCTQLFNKNLAKLCVKIPNGAIMHDWWVALVASYFGKIVFLEDKSTLYRQHNSNTIGSKGFSFKRVLQKVLVDRDILGKNIAQARAFLKRYGPLLDRENVSLIEGFLELNKMGFVKKRKFLYKNRLFKHGFLRNLWMFLRV